MSHAIGDREAVAALAAGLPARWRDNLITRLENKVGGYSKGAKIVLGQAAFRAKEEIASAVRTLAAVRVPLDAQDADVCARADALADWCMSLGTLPEMQRQVGRCDADGELLFWPRLAEKMSQVATDQGITPPDVEKLGAQPVCARLMCALWWRRALRKHHARSVEGTAIALGLVNKRVDPYVSRESLARRQQQNKRNADTLARTVATNESGQEFTLAELAAKGTANKAIRRAELMTRIAGFERIAKDLGHVGLFFTLTCPSRMHRFRTVNKGKTVVENPKYDGTLPRDAQAHLSAVWARIRAALARMELGLYGFRISEPQHDGTPHWHFLVFHPDGWPGRKDAAALPRIAAIIRRYALGAGEAKAPKKSDLARAYRNESGCTWAEASAQAGKQLHAWRVADRQAQNAEPGAKQHRADFKVIDAAKGSAAGYIAKYVAKNIDGYALEKDLLGNDVMTAAQRVEAWAATWGMRQFQQVGGPPVTVWRELRRVKVLAGDAPDHLKAAHVAVNKETAEGEERAADWAAYVKAQGGIYCGRKYAIRLAHEAREGAGRYGDALAPSVVGVATMGARRVIDGICDYMDFDRYFAKSTRYDWTITAGKRGGQQKSDGEALRLAGWLGGRSPLGVDVARLAAPWTRVNNCTGAGDPDLDLAEFPHLFQPWGTLQ